MRHIVFSGFIILVFSLIFLPSRAIALRLPLGEICSSVGRDFAKMTEGGAHIVEHVRGDEIMSTKDAIKEEAVHKVVHKSVDVLIECAHNYVEYKQCLLRDNHKRSLQ